MVNKIYNKEKNIIFLSNAIAGIAAFQSNIINFFSSKSIKTILIDSNNETINSLYKRKYTKFYKCDPLRNFLKLIQILKQINRLNTYKDNVFIISNTTIYVIYFLLIKLIFKNSKIILFYHSHIYNFNFTQITAGFLSSILSIFNTYNIYVSKYTLNWWNTYFPLSRIGNQKIMYNYLSLPKRIYKNNFKKLKIGFIGRLEKEKGIQKFLKVANNISKKKFEFYIFGEGSIRIKKKYTNIKMYKWTQKEKIYNRINLLFVTSKIENCPLSVLEAKSYGIPTIAISKGGIKEIIKNYKDGIILDQNIPIKKIEKNFINIFNQLNFYRKNCIKNSKNFSSNNYNEMINLIKF